MPQSCKKLAGVPTIPGILQRVVETTTQTSREIHKYLKHRKIYEPPIDRTKMKMKVNDVRVMTQWAAMSGI